MPLYEERPIPTSQSPPRKQMNRPQINHLHIVRIHTRRPLPLSSLPFYSPITSAPTKPHPCTLTFEVAQNGIPYALGRTMLNMTSHRCYNDHLALAHDVDAVCLPNDDEPAYRWGFSTMLTTVVLAVHAAWAVSTYALWMDAMVNSEMVRAGVKLDPLRAAFAVCAAAGEESGMGVVEMVRAEKGVLKGLKERDCVVEERHLGRGNEARGMTAGDLFASDKDLRRSSNS